MAARLGARSAALFVAVFLMGPMGVASKAHAQVPAARFVSGTRHLAIEWLTDSLAHVELTSKPTGLPTIPTSPMVARTEFPGPTSFSRSSDGQHLETARLRLDVEPASLCLSAFDKKTSRRLTRVCPIDLEQDWKGLTLTQQATSHLYGLGQQHRDRGFDGDWLGGQRIPGGENGNAMVPMGGGATGNTQIPILYALAGGNQGYALFLDNVYKQQWDFTADPWRVQMWGDQIRFYLFAGDGLPQLRQAYMDLVGRPLVPPKKLFGLWISEYGYRDWSEVEAKLASLRAHHFPVDGFLLDLFWFGGVTSDSDDSLMGRVSWDLTHFPSPKAELAKLAANGAGIIPIEESYISKNLPEHADLASRGFLVRNEQNQPAYLSQNGWWGRGGMMDWSNARAADYWHKLKRLPLIVDGIVGHWLDLGEPEISPPDARYAGGREPDVHNVYNLDWIAGIYRGYRKYTPGRRPFFLARSGAAGMQRYGGAMWSGDIGSAMANLAAHENAQMHMSLSGIDYFGSDVGGFHREALDGDLDELYTQWFADAMLIDTPGRPHTENLCRCKETSPDRIGDVQSNLENLRQRYRLLPYVYSLAHLAHEKGDPVFPPPFYYFPDEELQGLGGEKMIGPWLIARLVAKHGQVRTDVTLPRGTWYDFRSGKKIVSRGQALAGVPLFPRGSFVLPLYARAGAIVPLMFVDELTLNALGQRSDGSRRDDLIVRVYPGASPTRFPLYEDDGQTTAYLTGSLRRTWLSQTPTASGVTVTIGNPEGSYAGAPESRNHLVQLVVGKAVVSSVTLDGKALARVADRRALEVTRLTGGGWYYDGTMVVAQSGETAASGEKRFELHFTESRN